VVCRFRPLNINELKDTGGKSPYTIAPGGIMCGNVTDNLKGQQFGRFDTVLGPEALLIRTPTSFSIDFT